MDYHTDEKTQLPSKADLSSGENMRSHVILGVENLSDVSLLEEHILSHSVRFKTTLTESQSRRNPDNRWGRTGARSGSTPLTRYG